MYNNRPDNFLLFHYRVKIVRNCVEMGLTVRGKSDTEYGFEGERNSLEYERVFLSEWCCYIVEHAKAK